VIVPLVPPGFTLFAQALSPAPSWTDKEVLVAVGSVVATLLTAGVSVFIFLFRTLRAGDRKKVRKLEVESQNLRGTVIDLQQQVPGLTSRLAGVAKAFDEATAQFQQVQQEKERLASEKAHAEDQLAVLVQLADQLKDSLGGQQSDAAAGRKRIDRALRKDGQIWRERVLHDAPDFKPLLPEVRSTPVISVLNLKGGVGKTTVTANLGAALDPFPYGGGTTTCDTLWMGVPVVNLAGQTAAGRGGLSILSNVGLAALVAHDAEQYVRIAAGLVEDLPRLGQLRAGLRERLESSPLMDGPRFARGVEAAYRGMWRRRCASPEGRSP
jgi:hypothetical protein